VLRSESLLYREKEPAVQRTTEVLSRVFCVLNENIHQGANSFTSQTYKCGGAKGRPFGVGFGGP